MKKCFSGGVFLAISAALGAQVTVLQNVDLIDGAGGGPLRGVSIVIAGGRVRSIGPAGQVKAPGGANVVDLSGNSVNAVDQLHRPVGLEQLGEAYRPTAQIYRLLGAADSFAFAREASGGQILDRYRKRLARKDGIPQDVLPARSP